MWDFYSMESELHSAGFKAIRRARFGDSLNSRFQEVEAPERWENCLGLECEKAGE
jgi:hypothetical protein